MCATTADPPPRHVDVVSEQSGLYGLFRVGAAMFEHPNDRQTIRLACAAVEAVSHCEVRAAYTARHDRLNRYSGRANRRLDLLLEAAGFSDGSIDDDGDAWVYALFLWGNGKANGCLVLEAATAPTDDEMFLLRALAQPTGAALAAAEIISRERRQARELRKLGEAEAGSNRAMAKAIVRLNVHQRVRDAISAAAASGDGEVAIVDALRAVTRRPVVLQDSFGKQRAYAPANEQPAPSWTLVPDERNAVASPSLTGWRAWSIRSGGEMVGLIGVHDPDHTMDEDDRFAVEYASTSIAVELAHHRRLAEVELRLGRDLADDLVSGADPSGSMARAEALGYDLGGPQRVILASWRLPAPSGIDLDSALLHVLESMHVTALVSQHGDATMAVVADTADWSSLYARISVALGDAAGSIGLGGRSSAEGLPGSLAEASRALRIRIESREPRGLSNHDDLGLVRILDSSDGGASVERYVLEWLGPLVEYDAAHRSDLVRTLAVHLDSGGNYDRAAAALLIHRSTLRYRLGRIRELCGRDLADPDTRLNFHVATRVWAATGGTNR